MKKKTAAILLALACLSFLSAVLILRSPRRGGGVSCRRAPAEAVLFGADGDGPIDRTEILPDRPVNINTADKDELMRLPGIGEKLAEAILRYRQQQGPFPDTEALAAVPGIGPKKLEDIKERVTVEEAP